MDDRDLVPEGKYVYVTQPRRIAAVTIAERVAAERGEAVGRSALRKTSEMLFKMY